MVHILYNICNSLKIVDKEQIYVVNQWISENKPKSLIFTRKKEITDLISHNSRIKEVTVFRKHNILGVKVEKLKGYSYLTFNCPKHIIPKKIKLEQLFEKRSEGDLVVYVR
jgi:hypothetical protein